MNNLPQNIIEIEISAEKIYYTIIGKKKEMENLLVEINKKKKNQNITYIISKLIVPVANILDDLDYNVILASDAEQVQCSVLCDCNIKEEKEVYTLLCIFEENNNLTLKFPEIDLKENFEPEKIIIEDIKKIVNIVPNPIKNSLRLIDITGIDSDILVYIARMGVSKKTNKKI